MCTVGPWEPAGADSGTSLLDSMSENELLAHKLLSHKTQGSSRKTKGYLHVWANNQRMVGGTLTLVIDTNKMGGKPSDVEGRRISTV